MRTCSHPRLGRRIGSVDVFAGARPRRVHFGSFRGSFFTNDQYTSPGVCSCQISGEELHKLHPCSFLSDLVPYHRRRLRLSRNLGFDALPLHGIPSKAGADVGRGCLFSQRLRGCGSLTDIALISLTSLKSLERLDLRGCKLVTDQGTS